MSQTEAKELKIYDVTNRNTGEKRFACGYSAQEACESKGWLIGDCYVVEQKPRSKSVEKGQPLVLYKVPCQVCPFQYTECLRPADQDCPVRPNAPELNEWLKQAVEAHHCLFYGQDLSNTDYHHHQKWLPMEQAIEELGDHH